MTRRARRNPWTESMKQTLQGYSPDGTPVRVLGRQGLEGRIEWQRGRPDPGSRVVTGHGAEVFFKVIFDSPIPLKDYLNALGRYDAQRTLDSLASMGALPPQAVIRMTTEEALERETQSLLRARPLEQVLAMGILITFVIVPWRAVEVNLEKLKRMWFVEITSGKGSLQEKLMVVPARYVGPYTWEGGSGWRFELIDPEYASKWEEEFGPVTDTVKGTYSDYVGFLNGLYVKQMEKAGVKLPNYVIQKMGEDDVAVFAEPLAVDELSALFDKFALKSKRIKKYGPELVERQKAKTLRNFLRLFIVSIRDSDLQNYAIRPLRDEYARALIAEFTDVDTGEFEIA